MKHIKKVFTVTLAVVMLFGLNVVNVGAESNDPSVQYGVSGIHKGSTVVISRGNDMANDWIVVDDKTNTGENNGYFCLSKTAIDSDTFNNRLYRGTWIDEGNLSNYCSSKASLTDPVICTTKNDDYYEYIDQEGNLLSFSNAGNNNNLYNSNIFIPSIEELVNADYGLDSNEKRILHDKSGNAVKYWTRSASQNEDYNIGIVNEEGEITNQSCTTSAYIRYACNLDINKVAYTTPAYESKPEYGPVSSTSEKNDLKVTSEVYRGVELGLNLSEGNSTIVAGQKAEVLTIGHKSLSDLNNGRVEKPFNIFTGMLKDSDDNILYYGVLSSGENNYINEIAIPSTLAPGKYTFELRAEGLRNNDEFDVASSPECIEITVEEPTYTVGSDTKSVTFDDVNCDYEDVPANAVNVLNTGNMPVNVSFSELNNFDVSYDAEATALNPGDSFQLSVSPVNELKPGTYDETLTVTTDSNTKVDIPISFTVKEHKFSDWVETKAATCIVKGRQSRYCLTCGVSEVEEIPMVDHSWSEWKTSRETTCTEMGSEKRFCGECKGEETRTIEANGHDWDGEYTIEKMPTCTEYGKKSIHCSNCSATKDEQAIVPNGHNWSSWIVLKDPNCFKEGIEGHTCYICRLEEKRSIDKLGHKNRHYKIAAKIGVAGSEYDKCIVCGAVSNKKSIAALKPATTSITKLTRYSKAFTVRWIKKSYTGYQIRYSTKSSMSSPMTVTVPKASTVSKKITKLKKKKTYYVQVRTYKTVNGKKCYSNWSTKKSVKTK